MSACFISSGVLGLLGRDVSSHGFFDGIQFLDERIRLLCLLIARIYVIFIRYTSVVGLFIGLGFVLLLALLLMVFVVLGLS
jgi:hypothetical protein